MMLNMFRDQRFIWQLDYDFRRIDDSVSPTDAMLYKPDAAHDRTAVDLYDTNFVPDVLAVNVSFELARGPLSSSKAIWVPEELNSRR